MASRYQTDRQGEILERLGFRMDGEQRDRVPSWRRDIDGQADLVEEVTRIIGYDAIPSTALSAMRRRRQGRPPPARR